MAPSRVHDRRRREAWRWLVGSVVILLLLGRQIGGLLAEELPGPNNCPGPGKPLQMYTIARGAVGQLAEASEAVMRSTAELTAWWERLALPFSPTLPAPEVDFEQQMILAVSAGEGRGVIETEITRVEGRGPCLVVMIAERRLPASIPSGSFLAVRPFHLARVEATPTTVVFQQLRTARVKAERAAVWQAMEALLSARGETVATADQAGGVLTTAPLPVPTTRLAEIVRQKAGNDWQQGQYQLELRLGTGEGPDVQVEVSMQLACLGRPERQTDTPAAWWPCPSTGVMEAEILEALTGRITSP